MPRRALQIPLRFSTVDLSSNRDRISLHLHKRLGKNPKPEIREPKAFRNPKPELLTCPVVRSPFGFRASGFLRASNFRISDLDEYQRWRLTLAQPRDRQEASEALPAQALPPLQAALTFNCKPPRERTCQGGDAGESFSHGHGATGSDQNLSGTGYDYFKHFTLGSRIAS